MNIDHMTEKQLREEKARLEALMDEGRATSADAIRLADVRASLRLINRVRHHRPTFTE